MKFLFCLMVLVTTESLWAYGYRQDSYPVKDDSGNTIGRVVIKEKTYYEKYNRIQGRDDALNELSRDY